MKESVPFVFGVKAEGETFTDGREETENLRQNLTHSSVLDFLEVSSSKSVIIIITFLC